MRLSPRTVIPHAPLPRDSIPADPPSAFYKHGSTRLTGRGTGN